MRDPTKLADIMRDENGMMCKRNRSNLQIQRDDGHPVLFEIGTNSPVRKSN